MQKQVNFFEQHVQWFALGLGGLFLLAMVFLYVLQRPVEVAVGGEQLGPGEVDVATLEGPVKLLRQEINKPGIPPIPQKDYVQDFIAKIQGSSEALPTLAATQIGSTPMQPTDISPTGAPTPDDTKLAKAKHPVTELPKLPAARPLADNKGRSQVTFQDPNWVPKEFRPNEPPAMITADKDWWSGLFKIDAEDLAKSFAAAFDEQKLEQFGLNPAKLMETALIDVELVRQEVLPSGKWGKEKIVPRLQNSLLEPFPGKAAKEPQVMQFLNEVTKMPDELTKPVFYEVLAGDPWMPPGEEADRMRAADRAARKAQREQLRQQQRQLVMQRQQSRGAGVRRGPVGFPEEDMEMEMDGAMGPEEGFSGRYVPPPARFQRPGAVPGAVRPPEGVPLAAGKNNNVQMLADIEIIAHDDTVEPGKTYRYKLRYRLFNPVWRQPRVAPPELIEQFAITAPDSPWTEAVTMRPKVEFFLARAPGGESAEFDVFKWENGQMKRSTIKVGAGDAIGETGWSMVDVRGSGSKAYSVVMDEAGQVARRNADVDAENVRYQDLIDEVEAAANPQVGMRQ